MELVKLLVNGSFWIGFLIGGMGMFIFKPLVDRLYTKLIKHN